jgi:hypothetical protein
MADHGTVEYATADGNDLPAHEATYEGFVHLAFVGSCFVINIVLVLAIGAVAGHWGVGIPILLVATAIAFHGLLTGARNPSIVMVLVSLAALALTA